MNPLRLLAGALSRTGRLLERTARAIYLSPQERRVEPWFQAHGDRTLRLDYDLGPHSLVFDLGGYQGQWTSDIVARYECRVHVFEPVESFAKDIARRFERNPDVVVHPIGLGASSQDITIAMAADGSSALRDGAIRVPARLVRAADFFQEQSVRRVDLMKINIEGGEYDLLEHLLDAELVARIGNLQIQFHDFVPRAEERMRAIQRRLAVTHQLTYQYEFVWENWALRTGAERAGPERITPG